MSKKKRLKSLKPDLNVRIIYPKTIRGTIGIFPKIENLIGSLIIKIFSYRQKKLYFFI